MISSFCVSCPEGTYLYVQVVPQSSKNQIKEIIKSEQVRLKIKLAAPPVDGAANEALINFLSKILGIPKSSIEVVNGHTQKRKKVLIKNLILEDVMSTLISHIQ